MPVLGERSDTSLLRTSAPFNESTEGSERHLSAFRSKKGRAPTSISGAAGFQDQLRRPALAGSFKLAGRGG